MSLTRKRIGLGGGGIRSVSVFNRMKWTGESERDLQMI